MLARTEPMPLPALPTITTRVATMADLSFVDALQKKHSKQLGFFPRAQLEGYLANGWMRIAEEGVSREGGVASEGEDASALRTPHALLRTPVGYIAFRDRYLKRDELGAVFQLCVDPTRQRGLIGATLLQSAFDASAYGCRLFCCWCAQDLAANRFWEAMGFVPIAYRVGGKGRGATRGEGQGKTEDPSSSPAAHGRLPTPRLHIFWQKRIRRGDATTSWWYPSGTDGGALRAGRVVLPIPPGTHWSEVRPIELPGEAKALPAPRVRKQKKPATPTRPANVMAGGFWFAPAAPPTPALPAVVEKPKREQAKVDPRLVAASRELRDRWLEQMNASPTFDAGKYDVGRRIEGDVVDGEVVEPRKRLAA